MFCNLVLPLKDVLEIEKTGPQPIQRLSHQPTHFICKYLWLCRNFDFFEKVCTHPCNMLQHHICNINEVSMPKGLRSQNCRAFKHIQIFGHRDVLPQQIKNSSRCLTVLVYPVILAILLYF